MPPLCLSPHPLTPRLASRASERGARGGILPPSGAGALRRGSHSLPGEQFLLERGLDDGQAEQEGSSALGEHSQPLPVAMGTLWLLLGDRTSL